MCHLLLVQGSLADFWAGFQPDLGEDEPPPPLVPLGDLWAELRLRTAPWGEDDWGASTASSIPDEHTDEGRG